jgi:hypothetical protein
VSYLTPAERTLRARLAAHTQHAKGRTNTGPAREKFLSRFESEVDPDRVLDPAERARRAEHAKRAYFTALSLKAARQRRMRGSQARDQRSDLPSDKDDSQGPNQPDRPSR